MQINKIQNLIARFSASLWVLIIANIIPVFGVIFLKWNVGPIMLLYWSETAIMLFFNVMKMLWAKGEIMPNQDTQNIKPAAKADRRTMIEVFIIVYGAFVAAHGVFIVMIFFRINYERVLTTGFCAAFMVLFVNHAVSFKKNFINSDDYKRVSYIQLFHPFMNEPPVRIFIMHITLIGIGIFTQAKDSPLYWLLILIAVKTCFELYSYLNVQKFRYILE